MAELKWRRRLTREPRSVYTTTQHITYVQFIRIPLGTPFWRCRNPIVGVVVDAPGPPLPL